MTVGRVCAACGGTNSRAARYCQWCRHKLRQLEDFETPVHDGDVCPGCGSPPDSDVSWQTANGQEVCPLPTDECAVNTWGGGIAADGGDAR